MKKTIILLISLFVIFLASCKANTGPIATEGTPTDALKSVGPVLGTAYLWITITPGEANSTIKIQFGDPNGATIEGETVTYNGTITDISPTDEKKNTTYAFQTGTLTGSLEILDSKRAEISFTQNVTPYIKIMQAVCEKIN
ncbi:hypothetical protein [uncultured Brachyspira sp.]|uniref:hypothetical protein n=1 Tax=uncultured Brachyspira sp. TaxID=221953 RepID=UPI002616026D|nr:hypothetical protein [uncultured Brachyspira sp.]